jgi:hypothetical protein
MREGRNYRVVYSLCVRLSLGFEVAPLVFLHRRGIVFLVNRHGAGWGGGGGWHRLVRSSSSARTLASASFEAAAVCGLLDCSITRSMPWKPTCGVGWFVDMLVF